MDATEKKRETPSIRNLLEVDYRPLLDMYRQFQPKNYILGLPPPLEPLRVEWLRKLLQEKLNLVAETGGRIIGHASVIDVPGGDFCELIVFVHQDFRGRGLGTYLTEEICRRALYLGKKKVWLMVERTNEHAVKIYYKTGFRVTRMYGDVYEMELDIRASADYMGR